MPVRPGRVLIALLMLLPVTGGELGAQFAQYTPPGGGTGEPEHRKDSLNLAVDDARFRLGPLRVEPWVGIRDLGFSDQPEEEGQPEEGGQLVGSAGAGLRFFVPFSRKVTLAAHALPEYSWAEDSERSRLNGRYGVGLFCFWNRLTVEALASRVERLDFLTSEVLERTNSRQDRLDLSAELELRGSLFLFASARRQTLESLDDRESTEIFARADREETLLSAGVRYATPRGWRLGLGVESSEADFRLDDPGASRSSSGTAPVVEVLSPATSGLALTLQLAWRSLEPETGSAFLPYDGLTGQGRVGLGQGFKVPVQLYGSRSLVSALVLPFSYLINDRVGLSASLRLGDRMSLRGYVETGKDDYQGRGEVEREDDQTGFGLIFQIGLPRSLSLTVGASREHYESSLPSRDRTVTQVQAAITLSAGTSSWY
ncbi:MAG TPA: hypothetical protein VF017_22655 [Thermoanaerobaculia bacterium]|nr:hypothetical protein [Thermoanaerobaculia bacterium]